MRSRIGRGAGRALEAASAVALGELQLVPLSELGTLPLCGDGDVVAGVTRRFQGACQGTAVVAVEPSEALDLVKGLMPHREPLDSFVELGAALAREVVVELGTGGEVPRFGAGVLDERPLAAIVLGTHAPSDTAVLVMNFAVATPDDAVVSMHVYILLDSKLGMGIVDALAW